MNTKNNYINIKEFEEEKEEDGDKVKNIVKQNP